MCDMTGMPRHASNEMVESIIESFVESTLSQTAARAVRNVGMSHVMHRNESCRTYV